MTTLIPKFDFKNGGSTPTGAINRPINEKLQERVSALDFGAVGNGTTDDTAAIQAALNTGKQVFLPKGNYLVTSTLYVGNSSGLIGEGHGNWDTRGSAGTWISSNASPAIQIGTSSSFIINAVIDQISLTRTGFVNGGSTSGTGIEYLNAYYCSSRGLYIEGFNIGLLLGDDSVTGTFNLGLTFIDTNIGGCDTAINALNCADISFYGGRIGINGTDANRACGVLVNHNVNSFTAYRLIIANNSGFSRNVQISNATVGLYWITFDNCDMETATVSSVDVQASGLATFIRVRNCWIGSAAPLNLLSGDRCVIEENTFPTNISGNTINIGAGNVDIKNNDFLATTTSAHINIGATSNIKILGNLFRGVSPESVYINPASSSYAGNIIISDNEMYSQSDNGINILSAAGLVNIIVSNNIIQGFTNYGIRVALGSGQTTPSKSHYRFINNTLVSGTGGAITIADANLDYFMITNNDTSGCVTGISNGSSGTHTVIANNL